MLQRIRNNALLLVALVVGITSSVGMGLRPGVARAYHTHKERLLDNTADSLRRRHARLGLFKLSYGIIDHLQVSTYTMPWLLGAVFQDVAPNVELKSTFYARKRLSLSASFELLHGRILQEDDDPQTTDSKITYLVFPISVAASVRINSRVSTHLGGMFTAVDARGDAQAESSEVAGAAVVDLLQFWGMVEWRLTRVTAFTFIVRWVPYVSDTVVQGSLDVDNPTVGVKLQSEVTELKNGFALIPGFSFSWDRANIRLGVGYGDFFVDGFGLVVPGSTLSYVSPELDIFVRF